MRSVETLESVLARPACLLNSVSDIEKKKEKREEITSRLKKALQDKQS